ncbi:hypothetical protein EDD18DRAFT_1359820 [Armillaria luteobubalina]|uniref:Uncharacterized protein n=1 Tax=Armillaria luteobubalina TaxID=153913 RepID=A0AA39PRX1_9AGAR|nr:hypothetical protein EDD18DRAFT_1359820 [Armillaria luteobubalina]
MASLKTPFKISIPDEKLKLLQQKLELVCLPNELEDSGKKYASIGGPKRLLSIWNSHNLLETSKSMVLVCLTSTMFIRRVRWKGLVPGYGFSEASKKKNFRLAQYTEVAHKLVLALGYNKYVTQGGDWGCFMMQITQKIAILYGGKHSKAWHTNMPM